MKMAHALCKKKLYWYALAKSLHMRDHAKAIMYECLALHRFMTREEIDDVLCESENTRTLALSLRLFLLLKWKIWAPQLKPPMFGAVKNSCAGMSDDDYLKRIIRNRICNGQ